MGDIVDTVEALLPQSDLLGSWYLDGREDETLLCLTLKPTATLPQALAYLEAVEEVPLQMLPVAFFRGKPIYCVRDMLYLGMDPIHFPDRRYRQHLAQLGSPALAVEACQRELHCIGYYGGERGYLRSPDFPDGK